jgi:hypothetical protein
MGAAWVERHLVNRAVHGGVWLARDIDGVRTLETKGDALTVHGAPLSAAQA